MKNWKDRLCKGCCDSLDKEDGEHSCYGDTSDLSGVICFFDAELTAAVEKAKQEERKAAVKELRELKTENFSCNAHLIEKPNSYEAGFDNGLTAAIALINPPTHNPKT